MNFSKFWTADRIVGFSAIFISLLTLVVFIYQTNIIREQQRMSVLPYLSLYSQHSGTPNYQYILVNNGIGPAVIESVKIIDGESEYEMDLPNYLSGHVPETAEIKGLYHSNLHPGQLIPAGKTIAILGINNSLDSAEKLLKILGDSTLQMEIVYGNVYDERWLLSTEALMPQKLD